MTVVAVHQPNFMPWIKLLDKILASDVYVAYDTVQYTKSEYHSRQKMKQSTGPVWLTVPVVRAHGEHGHQNLEATRIDNSQGWRQKHLRFLQHEYRKSKYLADVYQMVEGVYARNHELLVEMNVALIKAFCTYLGSTTRVVRASSLVHDGDNTERLIQIVRNAGGDTHLTSTFDSPRKYIDWRELEAAGIAIQSQGFEHPVYGQLRGDFIPDLSALDMLFCCGPETADILAAGRRNIAVSACDAPDEQEV
jgi:hypothetical protein